MSADKARAFDAILKRIQAGNISDSELHQFMAGFMSGRVHFSGCVCQTCSAARVTYIPQYQLEAQHNHRVHKIGRCEVTYHVVRKVKFYKIIWDGVLMAQTRGDFHAAFAFARSKMAPKIRPNAHIHGEIIAYRGWGLMGDILTPLSRQDDFESWQGPVARVPGIGIESYDGSGLWAVKIEHSRRILQKYHPLVHGLVALSGTVVEYDLGYRAQQMAVRVLRVVPPVGDIIIKALEDRYQCQVFRQKKT